MASISASGTEELRGLLQDAVIKCSERCLYQSAKWAAELLNSLPATGLMSPTDTEVDSPMSTDGAAFTATVVSQSQDVLESRLEAAEIGKYLLAKTFFDCREYDRCAAVFWPISPPRTVLSSPAPTIKSPKKGLKLPDKGKGKAGAPTATTTPVASSGGLAAPAVSAAVSQKSLFLSLYAKYMSGEKRKDEESEMILGPADGGVASNKELSEIARILRGRLDLLEETGSAGQGWLEYLYGIVLAKGKTDDMAKEWLIKSLHLYPYNWGAWLELNSLIGSLEELHAVLHRLPQNIMSFIFHVFANQELIQTSEDLLRQLKQLKSIFPTSLFLKSQKALIYHHFKDFEKAQHIFAKIIQVDPHRLDNLDAYSNCLYVLENQPRLAFLAQLTMATDKFRPETCCVVGNYYSMKSEHEKAVVYFRRALSLDRNFLAAWTLMGHEYIEMKNTHAAIESYRRAVDVNRKDYRAWYGLGQTYEILDMHYYALFYYQRAAALAPTDPKMWMAVGQCMAKMNRPTQAVKAYKRALLASSYYDAGTSFGSGSQRPPGPSQRVPMDPEALYQLAVQYSRLGEMDEAKAYLELTLEQEDGPDEEEEESVLGKSFSSAAGGAPERERFQGVGVTSTTSKARMWLARLELQRGGDDGLSRAMQLANELCQDGVEVEEAKALVRDVRARMERNAA